MFTKQGNKLSALDEKYSKMAATNCKQRNNSPNFESPTWIQMDYNFEMGNSFPDGKWESRIEIDYFMERERVTMLGHTGWSMLAKNRDDFEMEIE